MEDFNTCNDCGFTWQENNALYCQRCGSGDFYTEKAEEEQ